MFKDSALGKGRKVLGEESKQNSTENRLLKHIWDPFMTIILFTSHQGAMLPKDPGCPFGYA